QRRVADADPVERRHARGAFRHAVPLPHDAADDRTAGSRRARDWPLFGVVDLAGEEADMHDVEQRLAILERRLRTQRRTSFGLAACLVALLSMGAGGGEVVQARRIELVDGSGKALITLAARDGRGAIELQSEEGQRALLISNTPEGGALALYDERAHPVVTLGADSDAGLVEVSSASGQTLLRLGDGVAGGALSTFAIGGKPLVQLGATADG